jgi:two-component sensor histidine kinase
MVLVALKTSISEIAHRIINTVQITLSPLNIFPKIVSSFSLASFAEESSGISIDEFISIKN